jgi:predicted PurR-regulated permease PerM
MPRIDDNPMMPSPVAVSYLLAAFAVPLALHFHLLPAVFAGLAVHVLTAKFARRLPVSWGGLAHKLALAAIVIGVTLGVFGIGFGLWAFLRGHHGMAALLATVAEILDNLKRTLPADIAAALPDSMDDLREEVSVVLRQHGQRISAAGMAGFKTFVHVLLGMVVGGMTALYRIDDAARLPPLSSALHARSRLLAGAFDKVVFAQVKISAINTLLTALYLAVFLPLFGVRLPLLAVLIPFTFIAGLLPVVGNLISNSAIVVISLGMSPGVGIASLAFLIAIHKLEYFTNARIVGGEVNARAWELLCAMLAMEAVFGIAGLIAAPVVYAWLKAELKAMELV